MLNPDGTPRDAARFLPHESRLFICGDCGEERSARNERSTVDDNWCKYCAAISAREEADYA